MSFEFLKNKIEIWKNTRLFWRIGEAAIDSDRNFRDELCRMMLIAIVNKRLGDDRLYRLCERAENLVTA